MDPTYSIREPSWRTRPSRGQLAEPPRSTIDLNCPGVDGFFVSYLMLLDNAAWNSRLLPKQSRATSLTHIAEHSFERLRAQHFARSGGPGFAKQILAMSICLWHAHLLETIGRLGIGARQAAADFSNP